jgi:hypothetical protein
MCHRFGGLSVNVGSQSISEMRATGDSSYVPRHCDHEGSEKRMEEKSTVSLPPPLLLRRVFWTLLSVTRRANVGDLGRWTLVASALTGWPYRVPCPPSNSERHEDRLFIS